MKNKQVTILLFVLLAFVWTYNLWKVVDINSNPDEVVVNVEVSNTASVDTISENKYVYKFITRNPFKPIMEKKPSKPKAKVSQKIEKKMPPIIPKQKVNPVKDYRYHGYVSGTNQHLAIIENNRGETSFYTRGDSLENMLVSRIVADTVTVLDKGDVYLITRKSNHSAKPLAQKGAALPATLFLVLLLAIVADLFFRNENLANGYFLHSRSEIKNEASARSVLEYQAWKYFHKNMNIHSLDSMSALWNHSENWWGGFRSHRLSLKTNSSIEYSGISGGREASNLNAISLGSLFSNSFPLDLSNDCHISGNILTTREMVSKTTNRESKIFRNTIVEPHFRVELDTTVFSYYRSVLSGNISGIKEKFFDISPGLSIDDQWWIDKQLEITSGMIFRCQGNLQINTTVNELSNIQILATGRIEIENQVKLNNVVLFGLGGLDFAGSGENIQLINSGIINIKSGAQLKSPSSIMGITWGKNNPNARIVLEENIVLDGSVSLVVQSSFGLADIPYIKIKAGSKLRGSIVSEAGVDIEGLFEGHIQTNLFCRYEDRIVKINQPKALTISSISSDVETFLPAIMKSQFKPKLQYFRRNTITKGSNSEVQQRLFAG